MNGSNSGQSNNSKGSQIDIVQGELEITANNNNSSISSTMPNNTNAVTPVEKFVNYSLDAVSVG